MAKIFIDAGHGGKDVGAVGAKSTEANNVLKVALLVKSKLEKYGHTIMMSRSTDTFLTLSERAKKANKWEADIFISLHNNSATNKTATGFETFVFTNPSAKALKLQSKVHKAIIESIGLRDRGMKKANYAVLRETKMVAVLIEYGFINNTKDEAIITDYEKMANLTVKGINDYYNIPTDKPKPPVTPVPPVKPKPPVSEDDDIMKFTVDKTKEVVGSQIDEWVKEGLIDKQWQDKFKKNTMTYGDYLGLQLVVEQRAK